MNPDKLLHRIKSLLSQPFGDRLRGVVLYGSEARGTARPDSDIDLLVLLDGPIQYGHDLETAIAAVHAFSEKLERRISVKPVDVEEYAKADCPLYRAARREGIAA